MGSVDIIKARGLKKTKQNKAVLRKREENQNTAEKPALQDFKHYDKATAIRKVEYWHKNNIYVNGK